MGFKKLSAEVKGFDPRRSLLAAAVVVVASYFFTFVIPESYTAETGFGLFSLVPAAFLIIYIFITKRILEALALASIMGFMMVVPKTPAGGPDALEVLSGFSGGLLETMMSEDIAWLIIVCGLMGSIIALIEKSGGAAAFGDWVSRKARTAKATLLWTWALGLVIFIDDYLNSLTVGSSMAPATDRHKTPREFLAYIVDSTAAPVCVLIPISTWAVFCGRLLETNGWAPEGEGTMYFIQTIPFSFYGWAATIIVPLVIIGIIPVFGPMKKAFERVNSGGPLAPEGSEKIDIKGGRHIEIPENPRIRNFVLPIIVLVAVVILTAAVPALNAVFGDFDMQLGVIATMVFIFVFYLLQRVITADDFWDTALEGIKNMLLPLLLMILAFLFASVNDQIGFTAFVIESASANMTAALMPLTIFLVLAVTEFITGTNWGMYVIALPIVIPLAQSMGVSVPVAVGAVVSAGVLGSHVCFYSDATILTSAATGCNNFRHALTQMPFGFLAGGISAAAYLVAGIVMAG